MNSKSEYNRCTLPRISTRNIKECIEEEDYEKLEDDILKNEIKKLRVQKRTNKINEEMKNMDMGKAILEVQNENIIKWRERKEKQVKEREKLDKEEETLKAKLERCRKGEEKRKELLKDLTHRGILKKQGKSEEWRKQRTEDWRKYRGGYEENDDDANDEEKGPRNDEQLPETPEILRPQTPKNPVKLTQSRLDFPRLTRENLKEPEKSDHFGCSIVENGHFYETGEGTKSKGEKNDHFSQKKWPFFIEKRSEKHTYRRDRKTK